MGGQGRSFTQEEISSVQKWSKLLGRCYQDSERKIYESEAAARKTASADNEAAISALEGQRQADAKQVEEQLAALAPESTEEEKAMVSCRARLSAAAARLISAKSKLETMRNYRIPP